MLKINDISKTFNPGTVNEKTALSHLSLTVEDGDFISIIGSNGAGKSTLMSVLFGMYTPEEGTIAIRGKEVKITNPRVATQLGIGMVHQHFKLVQNYTVLQNIVLGSETVKGAFLDMDSCRKKVVELSQKYGLAVSLIGIAVA